MRPQNLNTRTGHTRGRTRNGRHSRHRTQRTHRQRTRTPPKASPPMRPRAPHVEGHCPPRTPSASSNVPCPLLILHSPLPALLPFRGGGLFCADGPAACGSYERRVTATRSRCCGRSWRGCENRVAPTCRVQRLRPRLEARRSAMSAKRRRLRRSPRKPARPKTRSSSRRTPQSYAASARATGLSCSKLRSVQQRP